MTFRHNSKGVDPSAGSYQPIPAGEYKVVIKDAKEEVSKKTGYPMVKTTLEIIENPDYHGKTVNHYVVFIPAGKEGEGINVHFRKCIGVAYGGDDEVDAQDWIDKKLRVKLKVEEREWEGEKLLGNKVSAVKPYGEDFPEVKDEEIPF